MRVERQAGDPVWLVWHVEQGRKVHFCRWVDDESATYCVQRPHAGKLCEQIVQARSIRIYPDILTIFINPIEDIEDVEAQQTNEAAG
jgi:hypothetical protein